MSAKKLKLLEADNRDFMTLKRKTPKPKNANNKIQQ